MSRNENIFVVIPFIIWILLIKSKKSYHLYFQVIELQLSLKRYTVSMFTINLSFNVYCQVKADSCFHIKLSLEIFKLWRHRKTVSDITPVTAACWHILAISASSYANISTFSQRIPREYSHDYVLLYNTFTIGYPELLRYTNTVMRSFVGWTYVWSTPAVSFLYLVLSSLWEMDTRNDYIIA